MQLQIEEQALKQERDASKARLEELRARSSELNEQRDAMRAQWLREKEIIERCASTRPTSEDVAPQAESAQRPADLGQGGGDSLRQHPRAREGVREGTAPSSRRFRRRLAT